MPRRDSLPQIFKVSIIICLVCATVVSLAAVWLRPKQDANRSREMKKNILVVAGIYDGTEHTDNDVADLFEQVDERIIDLNETNWYVDNPKPDEYDQAKASKDPQKSRELAAEEDPAGINRREQYSFVYRIDENGVNDQIVLPIRAYGLWSTLWGLIAIDTASLRQGPEHAVVQGLTYYNHKETPGLGGEVDNPTWKDQWKGKRIFDANWNVILDVVKNPPEPDHQVEAISGATITSRGVSNMMQYWLGEDGFGPFLQTLYEELNR